MRWALLLALVRKSRLRMPMSRGPVGDVGRRPDPSRLRGSVLGLVVSQDRELGRAQGAGHSGIRVVRPTRSSPARFFAARSSASDFPDSCRSRLRVHHSPLLPETRNLFQRRGVRQMKPTAYLITRRAAPSSTKQLSRRRSTRGTWPSLARRDAREPPVGSPLVGRDRVILTPHTSFYFEESLVSCSEGGRRSAGSSVDRRPPAQPRQS